MTATSPYLNHPVRTEREAVLEAALRSITSLIGNVDHSKGGGENTARVYGEMLNDIRGIADFAVCNTNGGSNV